MEEEDRASVVDELSEVVSIMVTSGKDVLHNHREWDEIVKYIKENIYNASKPITQYYE